MFSRTLAVLGLVAIAGCASAATATSQLRLTRTLFDETRNRVVPVEIRLSPRSSTCKKTSPCPVAFVSPGYGLSHTDYSFIADPLAQSGYMVVAIQSVLPDDPQPANTGDIVADRTPMWRRGAENLTFAKHMLSKDFPGYDWARLVLIGHSNGGDFSALAITQDPALASTLITLDNRRYPLPRSGSLRLLSIRGSDFQADPGVLPTPEEAKALGYCINAIPKARHDDMQDNGPHWLKDSIRGMVLGFLTNRRCST